MNDQDTPEKVDSDIEISPRKLAWAHCPRCGDKLPEIKKLRYCIECGLDLLHVQEYKTIPPQNNSMAQEETSSYPSYPIYHGMDEIYPENYENAFYYRRSRPRMSREDILKREKEELWSPLASYGITFLAYILMNVLVIGLTVLLVLFTFNIAALMDLIYSPYFIIIASLVELVMIIVPVYYVGRYLQKPTLKNRLSILGFTTEGHDSTSIMKEVLIGIGFAIFGMFLVGSVALGIDTFLRMLGFQIINSPTSDVDLLISSADWISITLMAIIMILVVGTSEEILFRGFLQKGLVRSYGDTWGIIITAIIFAMIHVYIVFFFLIDGVAVFMAMFLMMFLPYLAISLMLGLLFHYRNENLIAVMVCHGCYDAFTILLAFLYYGTF